MPELPEVETIRRGLANKVKGKKIQQIWVESSFRKKISPSVGEFTRLLRGRVLNQVARRGKLLILTMRPDRFLLVHLKMTGQLIYQNRTGVSGGGHYLGAGLSLPNKFTRVIFSFTDQSKLFFNDLRKFGFLKLVDKMGLARKLMKYGPEPLRGAFSLAVWQNILARAKSKKIKGLLMEQRLIAGLGNIYADEVCFAAGVRPMRLVKTLTLTEKRRVFQQIKKVLRLAVKHRGTTVNTYLGSDGWQGNFQKLLRVYGRRGEQCLKCRKTKIVYIKINGRSSCYCSHCQK